MSNSLPVSIQSILNTPPISLIRRNHGLEHATLYVLAERHPKLPLAGHSDAKGFWIVGDVPTEEMAGAVQEALRRLRNGESQLAIHANCGTNLVISGIAASLAASLALFGAGRRLRDFLERLPLAATLATLALIVAQPMGLFVQARITTSGNPGTLRVVTVQQATQGRFKAHRILTEE
jgi:hypothetical protein